MPLNLNSEQSRRRTHLRYKQYPSNEGIEKRHSRHGWTGVPRISIFWSLGGEKVRNEFMSLPMATQNPLQYAT